MNAHEAAATAIRDVGIEMSHERRTKELGRKLGPILDQIEALEAQAEEAVEEAERLHREDVQRLREEYAAKFPEPEPAQLCALCDYAPVRPPRKKYCGSECADTAQRFQRL